ncbi:MAG: asparagine--tRNA ligase [Mycoplasmoidaceae bacterium]
MRHVDVVKAIADQKLIGQEITIEGWVKFNRDSGKIIFIDMNDGTTIKNLQIVCKPNNLKNFDKIKTFRLASAIKAKGLLKQGREPGSVELEAKEVKLLKLADEDFPLQNKEHSNEFLREIAHLKARATTTQAIARIRTELAFAIHHFFHTKGFIYMASPIITSNDCEGAGENFVIKDDPANPFFQNATASLTVSGQLNAESYALGMKKVYTFGPTFRAERSHTNRHLAEFWMVEPEINFMNLRQLMMVIEQMFKNVVTKVLNKCKNEILFLNQKYQNNTYEVLTNLLTRKFVRLDYAKAVEILKQAIANGHKFEDNDIFFGKDFAAEHERYLCEKHFQAPVFLMNFPKEIKAFYMKANPDGKTVAACDLLVPGVGEIVGGSQREDDYNKIVKRCQEMNIPTAGLQWYLDLRKYGYYRSAGFGLGFERFLMYIAGVDNVKDVIPFPRFEGELKF